MDVNVDLVGLDWIGLGWFRLIGFPSFDVYLAFFWVLVANDVQSPTSPAMAS